MRLTAREQRRTCRVRLYGEPYFPSSSGRVSFDSQFVIVKSLHTVFFSNAAVRAAVRSFAGTLCGTTHAMFAIALPQTGRAQACRSLGNGEHVPCADDPCQLEVTQRCQ